jgi:AmpE protein
MKLIILLVVLGLERYFGIGEKLKRFSWFDSYLTQVDTLVGKKPWFQGIASTLVTIAIIPLAVTLLCGLFSGFSSQGLGMLIWMILSIIVLLYSLGPYDIYRQVQAYTEGQEKHSAQAMSEIENRLLDGASVAEPHAITKSIFWQGNQSLFGVLFWFMLFGIFGALFYRCTVLFRQAVSEGDSRISNKPIAQQIQNVLDWIPVRIFTLYFALVGQFNASFTYWLENLISGLNNNRRFISDGGLIALGATKDANAEEYKAALSLIDRSLIIFLAIVALFTLGSWIY